MSKIVSITALSIKGLFVTLSIMPHNKMTISIIALIIIALSIMPLSIMTLSIMTLSKMTLSIMELSIMTLRVMTECCHYSVLLLLRVANKPFILSAIMLDVLMMSVVAKAIVH